MDYILNSAVITAPGAYNYRLIELGEVIEFLRGNPLSTIGYPQTAEALSMLTGISVVVNRKQIKMGVGDRALVFRLTCRLDDPTLKGTLTKEFIMANYEAGLLVRF